MSGTARVLRFLSRGDWVRLRLLGPTRAHGVPLLLIGTQDGDAAGSCAERALATWSHRALVAVVDLPLCGARRSDKLDPRTHGELLRRDLEEQLAADLAGALDLLEDALGHGRRPVAYVGLGLGAEFAAPFCEGEPRLDGFVLATAASCAVVVTRTPVADHVETETLATLEPTDALLDRLRGLLGA